MEMIHFTQRLQPRKQWPKYSLVDYSYYSLEASTLLPDLFYCEFLGKTQQFEGWPGDPRSFRNAVSPCNDKSLPWRCFDPLSWFHLVSGWCCWLQEWTYLTNVKPVCCCTTNILPFLVSGWCCQSNGGMCFVLPPWPQCTTFLQPRQAGFCQYSIYPTW